MIAGSLLVAAASFASPARAQSTPPKDDGWRFDATPYLWGAGINGDIKIGRLPTGGVEASFSEIFNSLHFAAMAAFEGRKDRWGFIVDAIYMDLSQSTPTPQAAFGDADGSLNEQLYTGLASYRVLDGNVAVDVFAGPRYVSLDADLTLTSGSAAGRAASASKSWWDGVGGARVLWHLERNWFVTGLVDVGGGGSKFTWEALVGAGYEFNKTISVKFGYRYLSVDYDTSSFLYDVATAGPFAGVGFRF